MEEGATGQQRGRAALVEDRVFEVGFEGKQEFGWLCECVVAVEILGDRMFQIKSRYTEVESFKGVDH